MSAVAQVSKVEVRGWDPATKKEIIGTAQATANNADMPMKPADLADKVGGQTHVVVDRGVGTQQVADQMAAAARRGRSARRRSRRRPSPRARPTSRPASR